MYMDSLERPGQRKDDMRFGTWTVGTLYRADSLKTVSTEVVVSHQMLCIFLQRWEC
jgi:hypothetical protein